MNMAIQEISIWGATIDMLRLLNRSIKVKALATLCNYSDDVIRKWLHIGGLTPRQEIRIRAALTPWVEQVMEGLQNMYDNEVDNEVEE